jgi:alanine-synthesizing transaminase
MADSSPERRFTRIDRLPPYVFNITAELKMAARRRGEDIIDFSMGNPDGATPPHIVEKLCTVAQRPDTHGYSTSRGIPRLRRAISRWYQDRYEVDIDPESEAIVTIGSKEGLAHLMLATLDHGDTVLVPNPSYPIHIYGAVIAGAQVRSVPLVEGVDFFNELERAIRESYPKPKMMILGFPSNPTAQCVELEFFEKVVALAKRYDVLVVHDLAYADIVYDGWKAPSIMQVPGARDVAVEFFTLSKSYNMAGWRIGFMVGNKTLVNALARIKSYHDYGTFTPLQVAAIAALEGDQQCVHDIAAQYKRRRDVLVKGLHEAGWMVEMPKASMYVWAKIPEPYAAMGSLEFAKKLLQDAKVCVSPGIGFGDYGDTHVRDRTAKAYGCELLVHKNPEGVAMGINPFVHGSAKHTDIMKTEGLKQALNKYGFDAAFGGARRDEEKSRAKERIYSFRDRFHRWDPKNQRPELWHNYNGQINKGESIRVFPLSNWTELDIWQYIYLENIEIVPLYLAAERPVLERDGMLMMIDDDRIDLQPGEVIKKQMVRFRTLGCWPLTGAVESSAQTLPEIKPSAAAVSVTASCWACRSLPPLHRQF